MPKRIIPIDGKKLCSKCGELKILSSFNKRSDSRLGYSSHCKLCCRKSTKPIVDDGFKYCLGCKTIKPTTEFHSKGDKRCPSLRNSRCKSCVCKTSRRIIGASVGYKYCYSCSTEKLLSEFYLDKSKSMNVSSSCKVCHCPKVVQRGTDRYHEDTAYKIKKLLRGRIRSILNGLTKSESTLILLGCTIEKLKTYLQQTAIANGYLSFNIDNYSGKEYHIDHIKPCSSFNLSNPEDQKLCFHYTNLQILTAKENIIKNDSC